MEDFRIVALLEKRDESAIPALQEKYGGLLRSLTGRILPDSRDAEECVNDVFLRLWLSIPPAKPENLAAYTAKTARNLALSRLRKNKSRGAGSELPLDEAALFLPGVETEAEGRELAREISRFLSEQSYERRVCFIKRYWLFERVEDIAKELGMTNSKVASLLFRTRNALRRRLEKEGYLYE